MGLGKVRDVDHGARRMMKAAASANRSVLLGVQGAKGEEAHRPGTGQDTANGQTVRGQTVGEVSAAAEFGLGQPERSWLRAWFDEARPHIETDLSRAMKQVLLGRLTVPQALEVLGLKFVGEIQARIVAGIMPENSPATIARKGSSTPLIDTGQFKSAITYLLEPLLRAKLGGGVTL